MALVVVLVMSFVDGGCLLSAVVVRLAPGFPGLLGGGLKA